MSPRSLDAEPDPNAAVKELPNGRDTGPEAEIRGGAVGDARARVAEDGDILLGEVDAVRAPDVRREPVMPFEVFDRGAPVEPAAVRLLLDRLRQVGVEREAEAPGQRCR